MMTIGEAIDIAGIYCDDLETRSGKVVDATKLPYTKEIIIQALLVLLKHYSDPAIQKKEMNDVLQKTLPLLHKSGNENEKNILRESIYKIANTEASNKIRVFKNAYISLSRYQDGIGDDVPVNIADGLEEKNNIDKNKIFAENLSIYFTRSAVLEKMSAEMSSLLEELKQHGF